jgi:hypothetical protein
VMILNNKITILKKAKGYFKRTKNKWSMTVIIKSHRTLRPLVQWALILALFGVQSTVLAVESAIIDSESRSHPVHGSLGMVVSQEIVASRVGADILSQGGNAIDAAVATGLSRDGPSLGIQRYVFEAKW